MTSGAAYGGRRLPPEFLTPERSTAEATPAPARHAATVVLLRDTDTGPEAYLLRRAPTMAFAAGMYVFPGGSVDPRDEALPDSRWYGPSAAEWAPILTADEPLARALGCAAVRETFEESGVLLAGPSGADVAADTTGEEWEADREALLTRSLSLAEMLGRRNLFLRADLLRPWAHWVTPDSEPRRFDTRFFIAMLPAGQRTRDVGGEADAVEWVRPQDALDRSTAGDLGLLPPTAFTLAELTAYDTVAGVLAAAAGRDIRPVLPKIVVTGDEALVLLPGEPGYPP